MPEKRYAIIHFIDGSNMKLEFPKQGEDSNIAAKMQKLLDNTCLMIEANGSLMTIPMSSIKYIQSHPSPSVLPEFVIKGAAIID